MAQENHSRLLDKGIRILFFNYKDASSICMENGVYGEKVRTHRSRIVRMLLKLVTMTVTKTGVLAVTWRPAAKCKDCFGG